MHRHRRSWLRTVGIGLLATVLAWPRAFSRFAFFDDEGIMLAVYRSFTEHGRLYQDTWFNYGPLPAAVAWITHRATGYDFADLTTGRVFAVVTTALTAMVVFAIVRRHSGPLAFLGAVLAVGHVTGNYDAPTYPGGVLGLLTLCLLLGGMRQRSVTMRSAIIAALLLTKINIGFLAALPFAVLLTSIALTHRFRRVLLPMLAIVSTAIAPIIVCLGPKTANAWLFSAIVSITVGLCWASFAIEGLDVAPTSVRWDLIRRTVVGVAVVTVPCLAVVAGTGTSPLKAVTAVIERANRQTSAFYVPVGQASIASLAISVVVTVLVARSKLKARMQPTTEPKGSEHLLRVLCGFGLFLMPLAFLPSVALVDSRAVNPPDTDTDLRDVASNVRSQHDASASMFVRLLAVLLIFQAYPVGGAQVTWATLFAVPLSLVLINHGVKGLTEVGRRVGPISTSNARHTVIAIVALITAADSVVTLVEWPRYLSHASLRALDEPLIRLSKAEREQLVAVSTVLRKECDTFYGLPQLASYYILADRPLPSSRHATMWPFLFDEVDQREVIRELGDFDRLCILDDERVRRFWLRGSAMPNGPLVSFFEDFRTEITRVGTTQIRRR